MRNFVWRLLVGLLIPLLTLGTGSSALADLILYGATYPSNGNIGSLVTIDPSTGQVNIVGSLGFRLRGIAYDPHQDILFGLGGPSGTNAEELPATLFQIDRISGQASPVGPLGVGAFGDFFGLAYDSIQRTLYTTDATTLYQVNPATGAATLVGSFGEPRAVRELTFDPAMNILLMGTEGVLNGVDINGLNVIDQDTGMLTFLGVYDPMQLSGGFNNVRGIEFDLGVNRLLGVNDGRRELLEINPRTGEATILRVLPSNLDALGGLAFVHNQVSLITVTIDIKPGADPNSINPRSRGVIPVAILTTDTFDATTVDPLSVEFGPNGATEAHSRGHIEDVDGDGDDDLVLHFNIQDTGIQCGDTSASLAGETFGGQMIEGLDSIKMVGCR